MIAYAGNITNYDQIKALESHAPLKVVKHIENVHQYNAAIQLKNGENFDQVCFKNIKDECHVSIFLNGECSDLPSAECAGMVNLTSEI